MFQCDSRFRQSSFKSRYEETKTLSISIELHPFSFSSGSGTHDM